MARLTLKRDMGVKSVETDINKSIVNYSIVNTIGGKYLKALISINKGRKYNGNRTKKLAV